MLKIRAATKQDKNIIAESMVAASGGMCHFLLSGMVPGLSVERILAFEVAKDHSPFSYRYCQIGELDGDFAGVLCAYPFSQFLNQMAATKVAPPKLSKVQPFYTLPVREALYIDTLFVNPLYRGQGFGQALLKGVERILKAVEWPELLLYVWSNNQAAVRLYQSFGFTVKEEVRATDVAFPIQASRLLMGCQSTDFGKERA